MRRAGCSGVAMGERRSGRDKRGLETRGKERRVRMRGALLVWALMSSLRFLRAGNVRKFEVIDLEVRG